MKTVKLRVIIWHDSMSYHWSIKEFGHERFKKRDVQIKIEEETK